jgi:hypothetical protein
MFLPRADLSAPCRRVGRLSSALLFFARDLPEGDHSSPLFFIDIHDSSWARACWNASCHSNGVSKPWIAEGGITMGTMLAVTEQQTTELTDPRWESIHHTDRCPRCSGLMVAEWSQDLSDHRAQRCMQCGEVIDPVILQNRLQYGMTIGSDKE